MKTVHMSMVLKVTLMQVVFLLLHFLYDWFPGKFTYLISATNESVYQHMKIAFLAYILVSFIEFTLYRKKIDSCSQFFYARALTAVINALLIIVMYFTSCAYFIKFNNVALEVIFSNVITLLTSISALHIERHLEGIVFNRGLKVISTMLFFVTFTEFVIFSYRLPLIDVFANPIIR